MMRTRTLLALGLVAAPLASRAANRPIAVHDVAGDAAVAGPEALQLLSDSLRGALARGLGAKFQVLSREGLSDLLPADQLGCASSRCAASNGLQIGAPVAVVARLSSLDGRLILMTEAYESISGRLMGTDQLMGGSVSELMASLASRPDGLGRAWLEKTPAAVPTPAVASSPVVAAPAAAVAPATAAPSVAPITVNVSTQVTNQASSAPVAASAPAEAAEAAPAGKVKQRVVDYTSVPSVLDDRRKAGEEWEDLSLRRRPHGYHVALRAGAGADVGLIGIGLEIKPSWWSVSLGTGFAPLTLALTAKPWGDDNGVYATAFGAWFTPTEAFPTQPSGWGYGASVGVDWTNGRLLALKTGIGYMATTANNVIDASVWTQGWHGPMVDLSVGLRF